MDYLQGSASSPPLMDCPVLKTVLKRSTVGVKHEEDLHVPSATVKQETTLSLKTLLVIPEEVVDVVKSEEESACAATVDSETVSAASASASASVIKNERLYSVVKNEEDFSQNQCAISPGLTTDLENFQDLTEWCEHHSVKLQPNMAAMLTETDELNTPIIELGDFLFTSPIAISNLCDEECYSLLNVPPNQCQSQSQNGSPELYATAATTTTTTTDIQSNACVLESQSQTFGIDNKSDDDTYHLSIDDIDINIGGGYGYTQYNQIQIDDILEQKNTKTHTFINHNYNHQLFTPPDHHLLTARKNDHFTFTDDISSNHQQQQQQQPHVSVVNCDENTMEEPPLFVKTSPPPVVAVANANKSFEAIDEQPETTINLQDLISCVSSANNNIGVIPPPVPVSATTITGNAKKNLRLDFSNLWPDSRTLVPTIDTPEVINTALDLDKGFNIVSYVNNEEILTSSRPSENAPPSPSTSTDPSYTISSAEETEDEDYEPPWKKRSQQKPLKRAPKRHNSHKTPKELELQIPSKRESFDSELSNVSSTSISASSITEPRKRGRPPKRNVSISSDSNIDPEINRYRELRDKNNEASRRSRLNRKMKELQLEEEAKDLSVRNNRLKVRVEELEKLVNNMRNNLMQLLLKK